MVSRLPGSVFLSHSSKDKSFVRKLRDDLNAHGFDTWMDAHDLHGGDALPKRIAEGIVKSSAMVVVLSGHALESKWLEFELQIALTRMIEGQLVVIPALLENVSRPPEISALVYADLRGKEYGDGLKTIITALEQREPEDVWVTHEVERLLDEVFDGRGFMSGLGEYRPVDYEFVEIAMSGEGEEEAMVVYEIARAYRDSARPLSPRWWAEYIEAQAESPEPYSLLITERPVDFRLPTVEGTEDRLMIFDERAPEQLTRKYIRTAFVVDISSGVSPDELHRVLRLVRDLVHSRETEYLRALRAKGSRA